MNKNIRVLEKRKKIALIAHDNKKKDLIEWAVHNKTALSKHSLVATGTTGKLIEEALDQPVIKLLSGPLGGDQQIGAMIATGDIDIIFFFFVIHSDLIDSSNGINIILAVCLMLVEPTIIISNSGICAQLGLNTIIPDVSEL